MKIVPVVQITSLASDDDSDWHGWGLFNAVNKKKRACAHYEKLAAIAFF